MTTIVFLGAMCGLGICLILHALRARTSLSDVGTTLAAPGRPVLTPIVTGRSIFEQRLVRRVAELLQSVGIDPARRAADLRVARRNIDQHVMSKLTMALAFGAVTGFVLVVAQAGAGFVVLFTLVLAAIGFLIPELTLTNEASVARKAFRHAFGAYLDLVNVMLAAGAGPEAALRAAAATSGRSILISGLTVIIGGEINAILDCFYKDIPPTEKEPGPATVHDPRPGESGNTRPRPRRRSIRPV